MLSAPRNDLRILVVNDDDVVIKGLNSDLDSWGYEVEFARSADELESRLRIGTEPDLLILEFAIRGACGLKLFAKLKDSLSSPVLFWTAKASVESAVHATKLGAVDVLELTTDRERLRKVIEQSLSEKLNGKGTNGSANGNRVNGSHVTNGNGSRANGSKNSRTRRDAGQNMLGRSAAMQRVRQLIAEVATTNANVLVLGDNGVGKELVAQEIHRQSRRAAGAFVPVDVGAISPTLIESTLFGYRKGAYTGAHANTKGYCELADGGTLFLDEIGELALELQPKLLRFLQHGVVQQLGSPVARPVDARVIAATNRDLGEMLRQKEFREDLFYRLNVFPILVPALRDRHDDIEVLAQEFVRRFAQRHDKSVGEFTPAAIEMLVEHDWPGNIRELENLVERMVIRCCDHEISAEMVAPEFVKRPRDDGDLVLVQPSMTPGLASSPYEARMAGLTEIEKTQVLAIMSALDKVGGNVSHAARHLGLGQATVYRKIKKYEIREKVRIV